MSEPVCELPRFIDATKVDQPFHIVATAEECAAIAKRLGLSGLASLEADILLKRGRGGVVHATGELKARLTQNCVVTLEDFESELVEPLEDSFTDEDPANFDMDDFDAPGEIVNGKIDAGELIVQTLSLALDPNPRKPGVEFAGYDK